MVNAEILVGEDGHALAELLGDTLPQAGNDYDVIIPVNSSIPCSVLTCGRHPRTLSARL